MSGKRAVLAMAVLALAACGGEPSPPAAAQSTAPAAVSSQPSPAASSAPSPEMDAELRAAVQTFSDGFLAGQPVEAYELFSARCQDRVSLSYFTGLVTAAKLTYGSALPLRSYQAQVSGDLARVTYTYDVPALNQTDEPWAREGGQWRQDDCPA